MGEFIAILTGVLWAIGVIFFKKSGTHVGPFQLNLFKNILSFCCMLITVILLGDSLFPSIPKKHLAIIFVSGILGVGIADLLFFQMLNMLGASRSALIDCTYSPMVILGSYLKFGETLTWVQGMGGLLILSGVLISSEKRFDFEVTRKTFILGALCGVSSMFFVAAAVLMIKPILNSYPIFWISGLRMLGGIAFLLVLIPFQPQGRKVFNIFKPQTAWRVVIPGAFIGSYLSLVAWLAGYKYAQSGIVALLNQMSTVFIVILAAFFLHEKMTRLKIMALGLALVGVVLVIL